MDIPALDPGTEVQRDVLWLCFSWIFSWKPQSWLFHGKKHRLNVRDGLYREFWGVVMRIWLFPIQRSRSDSQMSKGNSTGCFLLGIGASPLWCWEFPPPQGIVGIKSIFRVSWAPFIFNDFRIFQPRLLLFPRFGKQLLE